MKLTKASAAFAALGLLAALPATAQNGPTKVSVDNSPVPFAGQQPVDDKGHVLVPLRGVFEKMGARVGYDAPSRRITAKSDKSTIEMNVGSSTATVNGQPMTLDAPVKITNGAVLVPIRFLSESLGSSVKFDKASQTVLVDTSKTPAPSQDAAGVQMAQAAPENAPTAPAGTPPGTVSDATSGTAGSPQPGSQTGTAAPQPMQSAPTSGQSAPMQTAPVINSAPTQTAPVQTAPVQTAPTQTTPVQTVPTQTVPAQTTPAPTVRQPQPVTVVNVAPETSYLWIPWVIGALILLGVLAWYLNRRGKTGQVIAAKDDKRI